MKKEKIFDKNMHPTYEGASGETPENENAVHDAEDPKVIHIHDHDYERVKYHDEDEDSAENFFERFFGKRPSEKALRKLSRVSFILGVLSCSLLLGNLITSVIGILLAAKCEKHKYRSTFSTAGLILSAIGLIIGAILIGVIVLIPIVLLVLIVLLIAILLILLLVLIVLLVLIMLLILGLVILGLVILGIVFVVLLATGVLL